MMLKVVLACVVLMAGACAQDDSVAPVESVPVGGWNQFQCCLGGLRLNAWKGIYQLVQIYQGRPSPCCHQIILVWSQEQQCSLGCPCTVRETLCCGSCRERYITQNVPPDASDHWKEHECCRDWNGVTYAAHKCFNTKYTFRQEDNCRSACQTSCSWWWPQRNDADDRVCLASGQK